LSPKVLRLYPPSSRELSTGATMYEDLEVPPLERRDPSRPYVIVNVVSSLDGKAAIEGRSSRIGSDLDRRSMRTLRSKADAVMVGAGTLRAERLSLGLDEFSAGRRQPLAVVVTGTGDVPLESNLVRQEGDPRALVLVPGGLAADIVARLRRHADVLRAPGTPSGAVDLGEALRALKTERGVELLLVEGGPSLNHSLFSAGLADELFLTLAPKLLGGTNEETLTVLEGPQLPAAEGADPDLLSAHLAGGELFLRYRVGA
jgi:riboflavin-specific deaminase-like protein